jgi:peroxiredoxin
MTRCWIAMLLMVAFALAAGRAGAGAKDQPKFKDLKFDGKLTNKDDRDPKRKTPCKIHVVSLKKGQRYIIDMIGYGFDAFLRLEDDAGKELAEDDDSGGDLNAQIVFECTRDGDYKIFCTSVGPANGKYTLTVKLVGALTASAAHSGLLGKPAPDLDGDFAVGGKPARLSSLKGKVVLLHFWAVQSGQSVAAVPRLRGWHKSFKDDGLEIVGVTYFNSEFGHRLGFDAETGGVTKVASASADTDRELLKAFAAHHKIEYPVMALHREKCLKVFDAYIVDGLPQTVLIDRRGNVHAVYVGGSTLRNPELEAEIKKLLADGK